MMNKIFFSKLNQAFFDIEINTEIPNDAVFITYEQHMELLNALNSQCIIFDDLTYSPPKPSQFHNWIDGKWILDEQLYKKSLVPTQITKRQLMLQLNKLGFYQKIMGLINKPEYLDLKIECDCSTEFGCKHSLIIAIAKQFDLSDDDIDNLFIEASTL
ncbi:hypothetical protein RHO12_10465 [Orbus sturtevantii]|uniref:hypothetical protein n=1 Tax=Orbus sturtevantii TaxID=3074109 RepID=UPI00370DBA7A